MRYERLIPSDGFAERLGKKVLMEGVQKIEANQEVYIGPLASCFGIAVPLKDGAIIAHIPPGTKQNKEYFEKLAELISDNLNQTSSAFLFYKKIGDDAKPDNLEKRYIEIIKQILQKLGLQTVRGIEYNQDNTFVIINTGTNKLTVGPMVASELIPTRGYTPTEFDY